MKLNFDFGLSCRTSPKRCSQGSPCDWNLTENVYQRKKNRVIEVCATKKS